MNDQKSRFVSSEIFVHRHSPTPPDYLNPPYDSVQYLQFSTPPPPQKKKKRKVHKQHLICPQLEGNTNFSVNDVWKNSHIILLSLVWTDDIQLLNTMQLQKLTYFYGFLSAKWEDFHPAITTSLVLPTPHNTHLVMICQTLFQQDELIQFHIHYYNYAMEKPLYSNQRHIHKTCLYMYVQELYLKHLGVLEVYTGVYTCQHSGTKKILLLLVQLNWGRSWEGRSNRGLEKTAQRGASLFALPRWPDQEGLEVQGKYDVCRRGEMHTGVVGTAEGEERCILVLLVQLKERRDAYWCCWYSWRKEITWKTYAQRQ